MKKYILIIFVLIVLVIFVSGCDNNSKANNSSNSSYNLTSFNGTSSDGNNSSESLNNETNGWIEYMPTYGKGDYHLGVSLATKKTKITLNAPNTVYMEIYDNNKKLLGRVYGDSQDAKNGIIFPSQPINIEIKSSIDEHWQFTIYGSTI